jgi:exosome complex RNA-binding protein Rrp42 (RNase PH superfamily)
LNLEEVSLNNNSTAIKIILPECDCLLVRLDIRGVDYGSNLLDCCLAFSDFLQWYCIAGDLSVLISCASLALADAGIMMYDLITAVSVSCIGKSLMIDPVTEEEGCEDGSFMMTCMPSRYEITQLTITGEWTTPNINEAMQLCLDASSKLGEIMRDCLKQSASASDE